MILPKESATFSSCRFNFLGGLLIPNSRYKIGLGHSGRIVEVEHIQPLKISNPDVKPITPVAYDNAGMESED